MLGTTILYNGMILSTLSISSHGFAFGFPERPHTNGDVFLTSKHMINPLISQCGTPLPTILPSNKVNHRVSPSLFDTLVTFDYTFEAHNFFVQHLRILLT